MLVLIAVILQGLADSKLRSGDALKVSDPHYPASEKVQDVMGHAEVS